MGYECEERLERAVVLDPDIGLHRICWLLSYYCSLCQKPLQRNFDHPPDDDELFITTTIPCQQCIDNINLDAEMEKIKNQNPEGYKEIQEMIKEPCQSEN